MWPLHWCTIMVSLFTMIFNQTNKYSTFGPSKTGYFWIHVSVLEHNAKTTLRVVESGSPRLCITKIGWEKKNYGHTHYRANSCGNLVPGITSGTFALWNPFRWRSLKEIMTKNFTYALVAGGSSPLQKITNQQNLNHRFFPLLGFRHFLKKILPPYFFLMDNQTFCKS